VGSVGCFSDVTVARLASVLVAGALSVACGSDSSGPKDGAPPFSPFSNPTPPTETNSVTCSGEFARMDAPYGPNKAPLLTAARGGLPLVIADGVAHYPLPLVIADGVAHYPLPLVIADGVAYYPASSSGIAKDSLTFDNATTLPGTAGKNIFALAAGPTDIWYAERHCIYPTPKSS
jgi:hypothetical protein